MGWAEQEFKTIELGDPRLNRRAVLLAERLGQKPGASIPNACQSWAETAAAYRFLRNEEVSWEKVLAPHWQASQARIRSTRWCCASRTPPSWTTTDRPSRVWGR